MLSFEPPVYSATAPWFAHDIPLPRAITIPGSDTYVFSVSVGDETREFASQYDDEILVEDVGLIARGPHPVVPGRTVIMLGGITSRGVKGAALCFIDNHVKDTNERYLADRSPLRGIVEFVPAGAPITKTSRSPGGRAASPAYRAAHEPNRWALSTSSAST